jgi:hypothetical protein
MEDKGRGFGGGIMVYLFIFNSVFLSKICELLFFICLNCGVNWND